MRNAAAWVGQALDSVVQQEGAVFEIVVVDDGSEDDSAAIVSAAKDDRVILIRLGRCAGISEALNAGISSSRGDYIARMDADDLSLPSRLARQALFLDTSPDVVAVGSSFYTFTDEASPSRPVSLLTRDSDLRRALVYKGPFCHGSVMMRREAFDAAGGYESAEEPAEDYGLWLRLAQLGSLANLPEPLYCLRVGPHSVSARRRNAQLIMRAKLRAHARAIYGDPALRWREIRESRRYYSALDVVSEGSNFRYRHASEVREMAYLDVVERGWIGGLRNIVSASAATPPSSARELLALWRFVIAEREARAVGQNM